MDGQPGADHRADGGAARLAQQQRGLGIDVDEDDLADGHGGAVFLHQLDDALVQPPESLGQLTLTGADDAAGHVAHGVTPGVDEPEAGGAQPGVYAKDAHGGRGLAEGDACPAGAQGRPGRASGRAGQAATTAVWCISGGSGARP